MFECHGSIHRLQCTADCNGKIWSAEKFVPEIDEEKCLLLSPLPRCPECNRIARPNILMFVDHAWQKNKSLEQHEDLNAFLRKTEGGKRAYQLTLAV